jgi:serine/threonine-protein kinase
MPGPSEGTLVTPSIRLVRELRQGGMGALWVADHLTLKTQVVVKFIAEGLSKDAASLARFSREAAAASQVKSPHVVQMLDHGVDAEGVPFIVMELLDGHDLLAEIEQRGKLGKREVTQIIVQATRALSRAHEKGIVHRDIKPENIFLCDVGGGELFVKVLDFGIARSADTTLATTGTGQMIGTPYYMSPEQMMGSKEIDHRSDLWALGVVTYQMLTGKRPFDGDTVGALAIAIHGGPLPLPRSIDPSLPASVDAWFAKACARPVGERFQSARDLASSLCTALGVTMDGVPLSTSSGAALAGTVASVAGAATDGSGNVRIADARAATPGALDRTAAVGSGQIPPDTGVAAAIGVETRTSAPRSKRGIVIGGAIAAGLIVGGIVILATTGDRSSTPSTTSTTGASSNATAQTNATTTSAITTTSTATTGATTGATTPSVVPTDTAPPKTSASATASALSTKTIKVTKPLPPSTGTTKPTATVKKPDGYDDIQ